MAKTFEALQRAEKQYQARNRKTAPAPRAAAVPRIVPMISPGRWHQLHYELSSRYLDRPLRRIMFTGVRTGAGATHSAVQFGWTMVTASGQKVLLIDANLNTPRLDRIFNIKSSIGLCDLLAPNGTNRFNFIMTGKKDLYTFPCGRLYPDGACNFKSPRLDALFKVAAKNFDYVVLDSAPVVASAETRALCPRVDGVLLVIAVGRTSGPQVAAARKAIEKAGGKLLGVVLNKR